MRTKPAFVLAIAVGALALFPASGRAQTVHFVDDTIVGGANDGTSWPNAFSTLQDALDAAAGTPGPDVIRVAQGTYKPDTTGLADPRDATFAMLDDVEILGGFAGAGAMNPDARNVAAFATVLSGDIGVASDDSDNCYNVVTADGLADTAILDGFRVRDGTANGTLFGQNAGGNLYIANDCRAIFRNCLFRLGTSTTGGGGARITNSSPLFASCGFTDNDSPNGGGVYASVTGSGTCAPRFEQCRFEGNMATTSDGAAFYGNGATPEFVGCTFIDNTAANRGAGAIFYGGQAYFVNCSFLHNEATNIGGAGIWAAGAVVTVVNSLFSGNTSPGVTGFGAGIYTGSFGMVHSTLTVVNCTFAYNSAGVGGAGIYLNQASLTLLNSILYFNDDHGGTVMDEDSQLQASIPFTILDFDYNCIQGYSGVHGGTHNVTGDPSFRDADGADNMPGTDDDDLRLLLASPCIDAGSNGVVPADDADVDGDGDVAERTPLDRDGAPRFQDQPSMMDTGDGTPPIVDMGALESGTDCDTNGTADADEIAGDPGLDCDTNGTLDACETDGDSDGLIDACDNCPNDANTDQADADSDNVGDVCDLCNGDDASGDADGDGVCDDTDPCPSDNPDDPDGDGICQSVDPCPADNPNDTDGDGVCESVDPCSMDNPDDSDGDGVCDSADVCAGADDTIDVNANGTADCLESPSGNTGPQTPAPPAPQPSSGCCAPGVFPTVGLVVPLFLVGWRMNRFARSRCCTVQS